MGPRLRSHSSSRLAFGRPRTLSTRPSLSKSSRRSGARGTNARAKPAPVTHAWFDGAGGGTLCPRSLESDSGRSDGCGGTGWRLLSLPLPRVAMRGRLADLLDETIRPPMPVLMFAALKVRGDAVMDHPSVDLEPVLVRLDGCGSNSHEHECGWVGASGQTCRPRRRAAHPGANRTRSGETRQSRYPFRGGKLAGRIRWRRFPTPRDDRRDRDPGSCSAMGDPAHRLR